MKSDQLTTYRRPNCAANTGLVTKTGNRKAIVEVFIRTLNY